MQRKSRRDGEGKRRAVFKGDALFKSGVRLWIRTTTRKTFVSWLQLGGRLSGRSGFFLFHFYKRMREQVSHFHPVMRISHCMGGKGRKNYDER
jgi:hypothetical protein